MLAFCVQRLNPIVVIARLDRAIQYTPDCDLGTARLPPMAQGLLDAPPARGMTLKLNEAWESLHYRQPSSFEAGLAGT
jgi:hypothetical protein